MQLPPQLQPRHNDVRFTVLRAPGDPSCLCSRCLMAIEDGVFPILHFSSDRSTHFRYHPKCLRLLGLSDYEEDYETSTDELAEQKIVAQIMTEAFRRSLAELIGSVDQKPPIELLAWSSALLALQQEFRLVFHKNENLGRRKTDS